MKCSNCGAENNSENLFCYNCGAKLNTENLNQEQKQSTNNMQIYISNEPEKLEDIIKEANLYYRGSGRLIDRPKAFYLYNKALKIQPNNVQALNGLGNCYRRGKNYDESFINYKKAAELGDAFALCMLGHYYLGNYGDNIDIEKSIECFENAAKKLNNEATAILYDAYCEKYDKDEATEHYLNFLNVQADNKNHAALIELSDYYLEVKNDEQSALDCIKKAVELESPMATARLASLYSTGKLNILPADKKKGKELWQKAIDLKSEWATNVRAHDYQYGKNGFPIDYKKAIEYHNLTLENGDLYYADSLVGLGLIYHDGNGVQKDIDKYINYMMEAAKLGESMAQDLIASEYECGIILNQDFVKAKEYYEMAVENNDSSSMESLGNMLLIGAPGVSPQPKKAIELLSAAAEAGEENASYTLGQCYYSGEVVSKNLEKAREYFEKSARAGHTQAQACFADMLRFGEGGEKNLNAAEYWYKQVLQSARDELRTETMRTLALMLAIDKKDYSASLPLFQTLSDEGDAIAQYNLGLFYANGYGVQTDDEKAVYWLTKAAKQGNPGAKEILDEYRKNGGKVTGEKELGMSIGKAIAVIILTVLFFVFGTVIGMGAFQNIEPWVGLLIGYLVSALPLSVMRLHELRKNGNRGEVGAAGGFLVGGGSEGNGCFMATIFLIFRWIANYIVAAVTLIYWLIKSIITLIDNHKNKNIY